MRDEKINPSIEYLDSLSGKEIGSSSGSIKDLKGTRQKSKKPWVITASVIVVLGIGGFVASKMTKPKTDSLQGPAPVITVSAQQAVLKPVARQIQVNGTISAWDPISVGSQQSGLEVKSITVEEGMRVKKGQLLATLDSSVLVPELESEKAKLKSSIANAQKAVQPNRVEDINGLKAAVSQAEANVADQEAAKVQAQANLIDANRNSERYDTLLRAGVVSMQDTETKQTTMKVANAIVRSSEQKLAAAQFVLRQAREKLAMAMQGGRKEDISMANASVDEIRANVKRLEAQVQQTFIKAPVDGLITHRNVHLGDIATAGKAMFEMARDNRLELRAQLPESDLNYMKAEEPVALRCSVLGDKTIEGKVREISPAIDAATRLAAVRIDIPNGSGIRPGMYAEGTIDVGRYQALTVPSKAVISQDDQSKVFVVVGGNKVQARAVVTGARSGDLIEIQSGIKPEDEVAVAGAGFLKDGDIVAVSK